MFYTSPNTKGQTVITDTQRIKALIEKSKQNFFKDAIIPTDSNSAILNQFESDDPLNYDDDYYSNGEEEPAELNANFVGEDYSDKDQFYDYEDYDSIINRRNQKSSYDQHVSKKKQNHDNDYNYEYYENNDIIGSGKQSALFSLEKTKSDFLSDGPLTNSFKRRHSFSSLIDHVDVNEDYTDEEYGYYEEGINYDNDDNYRKMEEINHDTRRTSNATPPFIYSPRNSYITYDGHHKLYPQEGVRNTLPKYSPSVKPHKDKYDGPTISDRSRVQQGNTKTN